MIRRKIELDAAGKVKLAALFGISLQNVSQALNYKRNSANAARIREAALQNGGQMLKIEVEEAPRTIKVLNSKGEVVRALVVEDQITL